MESKQRNKQKEIAEAPKSEKPQEVIYVDRDRSDHERNFILFAVVVAH